MIKTFIRFILAIIIAHFITESMIFAQEVKEKIPTFDLEEVIVTASRVEAFLKDVPVPTTVITSAEIEKTQAKEVSEILRDVAGVQIKNYGGIGSESSIVLRGSTSSQVLVLLDGRPINSVSTGVADLSLLSLDNIERIEVVRGPVSHLYGANAIGGVVNIITKSPQKALYSNSSISYGSFATRDYKIEIGGKKEKFGFLMSGNIRESEGFRDNSDFEGKNIFTKIMYSISPELEGKITLNYFKDDKGLPGPRPGKGTVAQFGNEEVTSLYDHQVDENINGDFNLDYSINENSKLIFKLYSDKSRMDYKTRYNSFFTGDLLLEGDDYITTVIGFNLQYTTNILMTQTISVGIDAHKDRFSAKQRIFNTSTMTESYDRWNANAENYGLWIQDGWSLSEKITTTLGLRYDHHSKYGSQTNPSFGIIYYPSDWTTLRGHIARAYRAPGFNDLFWPTGGNPDLVPEKGWSYEIGIEQRIVKNLLGRASIFYRTVKDMIAWVPDADGNWKPKNINKSNTIGVEMELKAELAKNLDASLIYTYLDAEQNNEETIYSDWFTAINRVEKHKRRMAHIPIHQVGMDINYKTPFDTNIRFEGRYVGERLNYYPDYGNSPFVSMDTKRLGDYFVANLILKQKIKPQADIYLNIYNIFNRKYAEQFGNSMTDRDYPMPGRNLTAGINFYF